MEELRGVDLALLPIGGWGPNVGGRGHLDAAGAGEAAGMIRPRVLVPIHWGTYLRADLPRKRPELLDREARRLAREVKPRAPETDVRVLRPGQSLELPGSRRHGT
jgi:L-ascorbate metabolism protein UlaG (beta-lactamase superfamily)